MVEDDVSAQAFARTLTDIVEAVDHRQAIALLVAQAGADQLARLSVDRRFAIFDDIGADRRVLDRVRIILLVHVGHSAARVAQGEIAAEQRMLRFGAPWPAGADLHVGVAAKDLALRGVGGELLGQDADRNASRAINTARPISDRLGAAESDPAERFIELPGIAAVQFRENLPLNLARKIGARARVGHKELREAKWCAHPDRPPQLVTKLFMLVVNADEKGLSPPKEG